MDKIERVIELLGEIKTASGKRQCDVFYYLKADQAITKLKAEQLKHKTCMCMDCGKVIKVIKVTEQSKHLKECPKKPEQPVMVNQPPNPDTIEQVKDTTAKADKG